MTASSVRYQEVPGRGWLRSGSEVAKRRPGRLAESARSRHGWRSGAGTLERMFAAVDGTVDEALERRREASSARAACRSARRRRGSSSGSRSSCVTPMTTRDWRAAGCSSSAQWLAQLSSSDHRTAVRITQTSVALRSLPALDHALSTGALTLDQVAAAAEFATPESDAELARVAVGKPPSAIALAARTLAPPMVEDDQALYARRALSMTWTRGRRELCLERPAAARAGRRRSSRRSGTSPSSSARPTSRPAAILDWQQSAADALVTLAQHGGERRRAAQPDDADRARQRRPAADARGRRAAQPGDRRAAHLRRAPPHDQASGRDLVHSRVGRCASYAQKRALHKRSDHCQYPGCTATRELEAHHLVAGRATAARPSSTT